MAELTTLARPYAKAAFEVALADSDLVGWSKMLRVAAAVTGHGAISNMLIHPSLSAVQSAQAFIDVCGEELNAKGQNFIRLLAENKRIVLLPQISALFDQLKANQEKSVDVKITTAFQISSDIEESLAKALNKRLQREINLATSVDASLIGGAIIRAGDSVIDNSVRGKLSKLAESMKS
ncbi:MAG: F0F1 ATP synthase subunit delta [Gammaproteobacteria bacterium]